MEKVRINDLARELEVKSKSVLDFLPTIGVTDKKSHSSSIDPDVAEKVRRHFKGQAEGAATAAERARPRPAGDEIKTKIDLSRISKPGDVLKAINKQSVEPAIAPRAVAPPPPPPKPAPPATPPVAGKPAAPSAVERPAVVEKPAVHIATRPPAPPPAAPPAPAPPPPSAAAPP